MAPKRTNLRPFIAEIGNVGINVINATAGGEGVLCRGRYLPGTDDEQYVIVKFPKYIGVKFPGEEENNDREPKTIAHRKQKFDMLNGNNLAESMLLAEAQNPHITEVIKIDSIGGIIPYIVMREARGPNLQSILQDTNGEITPMEIDQAIVFFIHLLEGLSPLHKAHFVHGDANPRNCILESIDEIIVEYEDGHDKKTTLCRNNGVVIDLGTATKETEQVKAPKKSTVHECIPEKRGLGISIGYTPPESINGTVSGKDRRADIYSMGRSLWEALSGERPPQMYDEDQIKAKEATYMRETIEPRISEVGIAYLKKKKIEKGSPEFKHVIKYACDRLRYICLAAANSDHNERYKTVEDFKEQLLDVAKDLGIDKADTDKYPISQELLRKIERHQMGLEELASLNTQPVDLRRIMVEAVEDLPGIGSFKFVSDSFIMFSNHLQVRLSKLRSAFSKYQLSYSIVNPSYTLEEIESVTGDTGFDLERGKLRFVAVDIENDFPGVIGRNWIVANRIADYNRTVPEHDMVKYFLIAHDQSQLDRIKLFIEELKTNTKGVLDIESMTAEDFMKGVADKSIGSIAEYASNVLPTLFESVRYQYRQRSESWIDAKDIGAYLETSEKKIFCLIDKAEEKIRVHNADQTKENYCRLAESFMLKAQMLNIALGHYHNEVQKLELAMYREHMNELNRFAENKPNIDFEGKIKELLSQAKVYLRAGDERSKAAREESSQCIKSILQTFRTFGQYTDRLAELSKQEPHFGHSASQDPAICNSNAHDTGKYADEMEKYAAVVNMEDDINIKTRYALMKSMAYSLISLGHSQRDALQYSFCALGATSEMAGIYADFAKGRGEWIVAENFIKSIGYEGEQVERLVRILTGREEATIDELVFDAFMFNTPETKKTAPEAENKRNPDEEEITSEMPPIDADGERKRLIDIYRDVVTEQVMAIAHEVTEKLPHAIAEYALRNRRSISTSYQVLHRAKGNMQSQFSQDYMKSESKLPSHGRMFFSEQGLEDISNIIESMFRKDNDRTVTGKDQRPQVIADIAVILAAMRKNPDLGDVLYNLFLHTSQKDRKTVDQIQHLLIPRIISDVERESQPFTETREKPLDLETMTSLVTLYASNRNILLDGYICHGKKHDGILQDTKSILGGIIERRMINCEKMAYAVGTEIFSEYVSDHKKLDLLLGKLGSCEDDKSWHQTLVQELQSEELPKGPDKASLRKSSSDDNRLMKAYKERSQFLECNYAAKGIEIRPELLETELFPHEFVAKDTKNVSYTMRFELEGSPDYAFNTFKVYGKKISVGSPVRVDDNKKKPQSDDSKRRISAIQPKKSLNGEEKKPETDETQLLGYMKLYSYDTAAVKSPAKFSAEFRVNPEIRVGDQYGIQQYYGGFISKQFVPELNKNVQLCSSFFARR